MAKISKVRSVELLACDAGWRNYHFVKIITEANLTKASALPAWGP